MSKNIKKSCFFYSTTNDNGENVYRCLYNDSSTIVSVDELDYKRVKNYKMNCYYQETNEDLFKFRDDLIKWNDEIKQNFFKNADNKLFKVDVFNYNTINDAVYNNIIINSDQKTINSIPDVNFREFAMFEDCLSCGLMTIESDIIDKPVDCHGYDFAKYYYEMMRKIRTPTSAPSYYVIDEIDFEHIDFGIYRCKVECTDKHFRNVFKFNTKHHYSHNTLKTLYKYKDLYNITFKLLEPDEHYNYNMVWYEHSVELKVLFKPWFAMIDKLRKTCNSKNWLMKTYISTAWGILCSYNKSYINKDEACDYNFVNLSKLTTKKKYKFYATEYTNGQYTLINSNKAYKYGGLSRIKPFLTEFARGYIFNMISEHQLQSHILRIQTDGIVFNKAIDFKSLSVKYYPIPEAKSTGIIKFYNLNSYFHVCDVCGIEYKYDSKTAHKCLKC